MNKMNDRITISITPELHSAIMIASIEKDISISRTIENILRDSSCFRKYLDKAREYACSEQNVNPTAVGSDYIFRHSIEKSNQKEKIENRF